MNTSLNKKTKLLESSFQLKVLVKVLAFIPPSIYGFIHFYNADISIYINETTENFLLHGGFIILYFAWLYGGLFDLKIQESVLIYKEEQPKVELRDWVIASTIIVTYCAMIYFSYSPKILSILLLIFFITNIATYKYYLNKKIMPLVRDSKDIYTKDLDSWSLARVDLIKEYADGKWIYIRIYSMTTAALLIAVIYNVKPINAFANKIINFDNFTFSLLFFLLIILSEFWIWQKRLIVNSIFKLSMTYSDKYNLVEK